MLINGARGSLVVRSTMSRKVAGSIPDEVIGFFSRTSRTVALGSTHPLKSTRNVPGDKELLARKADSLTAISEPTVENVGSSTSHNPPGLHALLQGVAHVN
jgi:hypothetical protein